MYQSKCKYFDTLDKRLSYHTRRLPWYVTSRSRLSTL